MDRLAQKPKDTAARDIAFGIAVAATGLVIALVSLAQVGGRPPALTQATQQPATPESKPEPAEKINEPVPERK